MSSDQPNDGAGAATPASASAAQASSSSSRGAGGGGGTGGAGNAGPSSSSSISNAKNILAQTGRPQIVNLVATANLGVDLDLKFIALHARNAEYSPKRFSAVIMRIRSPQTTALVFSTGKIICTGAKSIHDAYWGARKFAKIIKKLGVEDAKFRDFTVQNMVAKADVRFPVRLEAVQVHHQVFSTYEPELFPGLIFRMAEPRVVVLVFVSGKVVITGAKSHEQIEQAFDNIHAILQQFRKS